MSVNEKGLMWGVCGRSRQRHRGSEKRAPGQFLRFFNKNYVILGIFRLKFLLQLEKDK